MRSWRGPNFGLKRGIKFDMAASTGPSHVKTKYGLKAGPLGQIISALGRLRHRIEFLQETVQPTTLASGRNGRYADWGGHEPAGMRPESQESSKRVDVLVRGTVRMKGEFRFREPNVRRIRVGHGPTRRENPVSDDSLNTASTPSPTPNARRSPPSPASRAAQKAMRSFSWRLYRLMVRSRAKAAAAVLLSSRMPSKTVRGSISNHRRSSAQSSRAPTPSRQYRPGTSTSSPLIGPTRRRSETQAFSFGLAGASRSELRR